MNAVAGKTPKKTKSYHLPVELIRRVGRKAVDLGVPDCRLVEEVLDEALSAMDRETPAD